MSIATCVIAARHAGSCSASQSDTGLAERPLSCTNNPPVPVMSTSPVSNRSIQIRFPVSGQVSYFAFPLRVSSIPSTATGSGSVSSTGSAVSATAAWQGCQGPAAGPRPPVGPPAPPLGGGTDSDHAGAVVAHMHRVDDDSFETEQQCTTVGQARAFLVTWMRENTQFTRARALNQSPTRTHSVTPDPH